MNHKLFFILSACCLILVTPLHGQEEKPMKTIVSLSVGLNNNQAWEIEPAITYYFCPYLGGT